MLKVGAGIVVIAALAALAGPALSPFDPSAQELSLRLAGPTGTHPFGLDELGRDILARVLAGARISFFVGLVVVSISAVLGTALGAIAGFFGVGRVPRILWQHVIPTAIPVVVVQATLGMAGAILGEAALSFLGLGVQPPAPSWGTMLNGDRAHLMDAPHLTLFPGLAIALLVLGFNSVGDGLRNLTDPKHET